MTVALHGIVDEIRDKLFAEIFDVNHARSTSKGFGSDLLVILVSLADVGTEADDFKAFLHEPYEDDRGVKTARVGEHDLLLRGGGLLGGGVSGGRGSLGHCSDFWGMTIDWQLLQRR